MHIRLKFRSHRNLRDVYKRQALALQASPYVAPALSRGQRDSTTVYSELYSATEGSRLSAQFDLYDRDGVWMYSTGSGPVEPVMPTQWGVLYAARQSVGLAFTQAVSYTHLVRMCLYPPGLPEPPLLTA